MRTLDKVDVPATGTDQDDNGLGLYVVTERPDMLARLFHSVAMSSMVPSYVVVVSNNRDIGSSFDVAFAAMLVRRKAIMLQYVKPALPSAGLAARKNAALQYLRAFNCQAALSVDDDHIFNYYTIERLYATLTENHDVFAVGPVVLQEGGVGIQPSEHSLDTHMAYVNDGVWTWGGFRQGVFPQESGVVEVEHLACVYMHRTNAEFGEYDIAYDRPVYFLHESDFVFGKPCLVDATTVVLHLPPATGNLSDERASHQEDIEANAQYFARKHGLGTVTQFTWEGFCDV